MKQSINKQIQEALNSIKNSVESGVADYVNFMTNLENVPMDTFGEWHHILPISLFPEYRLKSKNPWNQRRVSAANHVEAHRLLFSALPSSKEMAYAYRQMVGRFSINTDKALYEIARQIVREANRLMQTGKKQSLETIEKRASKIRGQKRTAEQKLRMSIAKTGEIRKVPMSQAQRDATSKRFKDKPKSKETKAKMSAYQKGRKKSKEHIENLIASKLKTSNFHQN